MNYNFAAYDDMIADEFWNLRLADLNQHLLAAMVDASETKSINGNLFYHHLDPYFPDAELVERFERKRRNLFALAKHVQTFFEVGVNGGHSIFLALSSNPKLRVIGVDICERVSDSWGPVDLYVPAAFEWLSNEFPGRCSFIRGNSLVELPKYSLENPDVLIDLLHLDGAKDTHLREFLAILPLMNNESYVMFDDASTKPVSLSMRQIRALGLAQPLHLDHLGVERTGAHRVFKVK